MTYAPYFTEEHETFRKEFRQFIDTEVKPFSKEWEKQGSFPRSILKRMGDLGYLGVSFPKELGGLGGDYFMNVVVAEEKSRSGAGGFSMGISVQTDMATPPIAEFGTEDQIERFLKPALRGEKLACLGITEPNHGSDVASIETRAVRDGDEWIINGSKMYITNGPSADFITLVTRTLDESGYRGISLFLVELDRPGIKLSKTLDKVGMRSSDTAELIFEYVRVPHANLLGEEGKGFYQIMWELQGERIKSAVGAVGGAQHSLELSYNYIYENLESIKGTEQYHAMLHLLAETSIEIESIRQLVYTVARRFEQDEAPALEISMAKLASVQLSHKVADITLQIYGENGFDNAYEVERSWRDTRLGRIGAGTDEIMKGIISKGLGVN